MKILLASIACMVLLGMATAHAADENSRFSLEYCPTTPTPTDVKGQAPNALTAKFGPRVTKEFKPYIGTGLAYSLPLSQEKPGETPTKLKTGVAGQAGFNLMLSERTSVNFDYKYLYMAPEATHNGNATSPHLFGFRLGCNF